MTNQQTQIVPTGNNIVVKVVRENSKPVYKSTALLGIVVSQAPNTHHKNGFYNGDIVGLTKYHDALILEQSDEGETTRMLLDASNVLFVLKEKS